MMISRFFNRFLSKKIKNDDPISILIGLWNGVDELHLGMGNDPNSQHELHEWPTAYSLLLSSLLKNSGYLSFNKTFLNKDPEEVILSVYNWLLDNQHCSTTKLPVWGLPYRRKIWIDDQSTKPNTGFNVPTVHGIHAMLDFADHNEKMHNFAVRSALEATEAWHKECSNIGECGRTYWYSTLENHSFHVTNAISLMAGAIQRSASYSPNPRLELVEGVDAAILYILNLMRKDLSSPTWDYFGAKIPPNKNNRNNDILHEAFVCDGLLTYKKYGGNLGYRIDTNTLIDMLAKFCLDGVVYDFPTSEENEKRKKNPARAIGLAHALFVACEIYKFSGNNAAYELAVIFYEEIRDKIIIDGKIHYRQNGPNISSYIRTRAHLIYAISNFIDLLDKKTNLHQ